MLTPAETKLLVIVLIFFGEALSIYAEVVGARQVTSNNPFAKIFLTMAIIITFGGIILIAGYLLGIQSFQNIWIVSVVSIVSILIVEPVLDYVVFRQLPTTGAAIGLGLGIVGFLFTIFLK